jgi:hypothetical protein
VYIFIIPDLNLDHSDLLLHLMKFIKIL